MTSLLCMRLSETFVYCLSNVEDFWDLIEEGGERAIGPIGLQQVRGSADGKLIL